LQINTVHCERSEAISFVCFYDFGVTQLRLLADRGQAFRYNFFYSSLIKNDFRFNPQRGFCGMTEA
jgi:hypothetical protein